MNATASELSDVVEVFSLSGCWTSANVRASGTAASQPSYLQRLALGINPGPAPSGTDGAEGWWKIPDTLAGIAEIAFWRSVMDCRAKGWMPCVADYGRPSPSRGSIAELASPNYRSIEPALLEACKPVAHRTNRMSGGQLGENRQWSLSTSAAAMH